MSSEPTSPATVLVVEDESRLADIYAAWLADRYDVRVAHTGEEALAAFDRAVDVVLLDRILPDCPGAEVLEALRRRTGDPQVAMVTAVEPDVDIVEMGFDDYLCKPVGEDDIREVVDRLLRQSTYDALLRELYALASKKGALEAHHSRTELAASSEYAEVRERLDGLHERVDATLADSSDDEFAAFLREADAVVP